MRYYQTLQCRCVRGFERHPQEAGAVREVSVGDWRGVWRQDGPEWKEGSHFRKDGQRDGGRHEHVTTFKGQEGNRCGMLRAKKQEGDLDVTEVGKYWGHLRRAVRWHYWCLIDTNGPTSKACQYPEQGRSQIGFRPGLGLSQVEAHGEAELPAGGVSNW